MHILHVAHPSAHGHNKRYPSSRIAQPKPLAVAPIAKVGLELIDAANPAEIKQRLKESASDAAAEVLVVGARTIGRLRNEEQSDPPPEREVDVGAALDEMNDASFESFDARLRASQSDPAAIRRRELRESQQALRIELRDVRRSFPDASKELAAVVFACVDLLEDLQDASAGKKKLSSEDLAKRETVLSRIASLLAPNAGHALESFVAHIVQLSRATRESGSFEDP